MQRKDTAIASLEQDLGELADLSKEALRDRWAELSGVELTPKARDLMKTDAQPALRAALGAQDLGVFASFHDSAYRARWCDGRDLSQPERLEMVLERSHMYPEQVQLSPSELLDELRSRHSPLDDEWWYTIKEWE